MGNPVKSAVKGISKPMFTRRELAEGKKAAEAAMKLAAEGSKDAKTASLSLR